MTGWKNFPLQRQSWLYPVCRQDGTADAGEVSGAEGPYVLYQKDFFGERITVSGLITGQDLMAQLKDQELGERLLIPCNMLKMDEDIFLDDFTLDEVAGYFIKFPSIL